MMRWYHALAFTVALLYVIVLVTNYRINRLERRSEAWGSCAHGIAVMTPSGSATVVCQP